MINSSGLAVEFLYIHVHSFFLFHQEHDQLLFTTLKLHLITQITWIIAPGVCSAVSLLVLSSHGSILKRYQWSDRVLCFLTQVNVRMNSLMRIDVRPSVGSTVWDRMVHGLFWIDSTIFLMMASSFRHLVRLETPNERQCAARHVTGDY